MQCHELLGWTAAELGRSNRAAVEERRDGFHLTVSPEVLCWVTQAPEALQLVGHPGIYLAVGKDVQLSNFRWSCLSFSQVCLFIKLCVNMWDESKYFFLCMLFFHLMSSSFFVLQRAAGPVKVLYDHWTGSKFRVSCFPTKTLFGFLFIYSPVYIQKIRPPFLRLLFLLSSLPEHGNKTVSGYSSFVSSSMPFSVVTRGGIASGYRKTELQNIPIMQAWPWKGSPLYQAPSASCVSVSLLGTVEAVCYFLSFSLRAQGE